MRAIGHGLARARGHEQGLGALRRLIQHLGQLGQDVDARARAPEQAQRELHAPEHAGAVRTCRGQRQEALLDGQDPVQASELAVDAGQPLQAMHALGFGARGRVPLQQRGRLLQLAARLQTRPEATIIQREQTLHGRPVIRHLDQGLAERGTGRGHVIAQPRQHVTRAGRGRGRGDAIQLADRLACATPGLVEELARMRAHVAMRACQRGPVLGLQGVALAQREHRQVPRQLARQGVEQGPGFAAMAAAQERVGASQRQRHRASALAAQRLEPLEQRGQLLVAAHALGQIREIGQHHGLARRARERVLQEPPGALGIAQAVAGDQGLPPAQRRDLHGRAVAGSFLARARVLDLHLQRREHVLEIFGQLGHAQPLARHPAAFHAQGCGAIEHLASAGEVAAIRGQPDQIEQVHQRMRRLVHAPGQRRERTGQGLVIARGQGQALQAAMGRDHRWLEGRRLLVRIARPRRIREADLEHVRLLQMELGALLVRGRCQGRAVEDIDQIFPLPAALQQPVQGPQVGAQRRIRVQGLAMGCERAFRVAEMALAQLAELVRQHGRGLHVRRRFQAGDERALARLPQPALVLGPGQGLVEHGRAGDLQPRRHLDHGGGQRPRARQAHGPAVIAEQIDPAALGRHPDAARVHAHHATRHGRRRHRRRRARSHGRRGLGPGQLADRRRGGSPCARLRYLVELLELFQILDLVAAVRHDRDGHARADRRGRPGTGRGGSSRSGCTRPGSRPGQ